MKKSIIIMSILIIVIAISGCKSDFEQLNEKCIECCQTKAFQNRAFCPNYCNESLNSEPPEWAESHEDMVEKICNPE